MKIFRESSLRRCSGSHCVVRARRVAVCCLVLLVTAVISRTADAAPPTPSPWNLHFGVQGGVTEDLENNWCLCLGFTGLVGYRVFRLGALAENSFASADGRDLYSSLAVVAGVAPSFGILRLDALATAGVHNYSNLGNGYDTTQAGPEASSGFLGTRLGAALVLLKGPHLELGAWFIYEDDLRRDTVAFASVGSQHVGWAIGVGWGSTLKNIEADGGKTLRRRR